VNKTIGHSSNKKNSDKIEDRNFEKNNINNNLPTNNKNNVIGVMKNRIIKETPGKNEGLLDSSFSLKNLNQFAHHNISPPGLNDHSNKKSLEDLNNSAMFNSMCDSNQKDKKEIFIDLNTKSIKADNEHDLKAFLNDLERLSNETKKLEKNRDDNNNLGISSFNNNAYHNNERDKGIGNNDAHEEFNDFDINNLNEYISDFNQLDNGNNENGLNDNDRSEDDEIENFAKQVREMNSEMNRGKETKKRKLCLPI
jgi:hypothetical protein